MLLLREYIRHKIKDCIGTLIQSFILPVERIGEDTYFKFRRKK